MIQFSIVNKLIFQYSVPEVYSFQMISINAFFRVHLKLNEVPGVDKLYLFNGKEFLSLNS